MHAISYPAEEPLAQRPDRIQQREALPDWSEIPTPHPLKPWNSVVAQGLRVSVGPVTEVPEYESVTAMPGNVFVHAWARVERVEGAGPMSAPGYWTVWIEGVLSDRSPWPMPGSPEPAFWGSEPQFKQGDIIQGWISMEVPVEAHVYLYGFDHASRRRDHKFQPGVEVVLRQP